MNCPKCNHNKNIVLDTRKDKNNIYRKRKCKNCEHIWFTTESESSDAKYDLQRAQYDTYKRKSNNVNEGVKIKLPSILYKFNCTIKLYDFDDPITDFEAHNIKDLLTGIKYYTDNTDLDISTIVISLYHREELNKDWKLLKCNHICSVDNNILDIARDWAYTDCNIEKDD